MNIFLITVTYNIPVFNSHITPTKLVKPVSLAEVRNVEYHYSLVMSWDVLLKYSQITNFGQCEVSI